MSDPLHITCPCCNSLLVVDPDTGTILREERRHAREAQSLDEALGQLKTQRREAEQKLSRAMDENRRREEILEKKFEEARRKAATTEGPPPSPFDND